MSSMREFDMSVLYQYYKQITAMNKNTYDEQIILDAIRIVKELNRLSNEKQCITIIFKILSTNSGIFFLENNEKFCIYIIKKSQEYMNEIDTDNNVDNKLAQAIAVFTQRNENVFANRYISYTLYYGYDEQYNEFIEEQQQIVEEEENLQNWKNKMKIVHDHLIRRSDPFYAAAMKCIEINKEKEENGGLLKENRRRLDILRKIIKNDVIHTNSVPLQSGTYIRCDYNLCEQFTGYKVSEEEIKKFGCSVMIEYNMFTTDCKATIHIFDGVFSYEYEMNANIPLIVSKVQKEIVSECLYDTRLVCKDVAGLITSFVC